MARRNPVRQASKVKFIDLFAGAGGLSEGFRQAGWAPMLGMDIDPDALATYRHNFRAAPAVLGDLRDADVRHAVLEQASRVDVVAGGPPCQGFSQVRNHARLIDDPKNALYREFVGVVRTLQPKAFVMENVPGMAQMGVLQQVLDDLACSGNYSVSATVVDAADHGVPQSRKRIVFLGVHSDLGIPAPAIEGTGAQGSISLRRVAGRTIRYVVNGSRGIFGEDLRDRLADPWDTTLVTASQALGDLAPLKVGTNKRDAMDPSELLAPSSAYQKVMRDSANEVLTNVGVPRMNDDTRLRLQRIPPGGNYLDLPDALRERYLTGQLWGQHNGTQRLSRRHYYAYRRLHPDIWSWTLNTKADSVYHWASPRGLSVREFARLQSFPDSFEFVTDPTKGPLPGRIDGGPGHSRYRQVGNAVPPLLARAVAETLASGLFTNS